MLFVFFAFIFTPILAHAAEFTITTNTYRTDITINAAGNFTIKCKYNDSGGNGHIDTITKTDATSTTYSYPLSSINYFGGTCNAPESTCDITSYTCNSGYNQTSTGACEQLCGAGFTKIQTSTGLTIPLYANKLTTPAINVDYNNQVCYGNLAAGAGA